MIADMHIDEPFDEAGSLKALATAVTLGRRSPSIIAKASCVS